MKWHKMTDMITLKRKFVSFKIQQFGEGKKKKEGKV